MVSFRDVESLALINKVASELKKNPKISAPVWTAFVKTGAHKERPPQNADWWHVRAASVLRTVALVGPVGTNKLVVKYGGKKRRGHQKPEFRKGSGSVARKSLQQLEAAGLIKHETVANRKGRVITPAGLKLLDACAKAAGKVE
jgi:small subunit ribosomal protein S19e